MFKLDDNFLQELGLGGLPVNDKRAMLNHIYETLEMRVGMKLAEQMTNEQLDEFESYINKNDEPGALKWLETNFPNYKQVVADELEKLKNEIKTAAPQIMAASVAQNAAAPQGQPNVASQQPGMPGAMPQQQFQQPSPAAQAPQFAPQQPLAPQPQPQAPQYQYPQPVMPQQAAAGQQPQVAQPFMQQGQPDPTQMPQSGPVGPAPQAPQALDPNQPAS